MEGRAPRGAPPSTEPPRRGGFVERRGGANDPTRACARTPGTHSIRIVGVRSDAVVFGATISVAASGWAAKDSGTSALAAASFVASGLATKDSGTSVLAVASFVASGFAATDTGTSGFAAGHFREQYRAPTVHPRLKPGAVVGRAPLGS